MTKEYHSENIHSLSNTDGMSLGEKQRLFMRLLPRLVDYIHSQGYEATLGDGYRDPRAFGEVGELSIYGKPYSLHKSRLAIDINLFQNNVYLTQTKHHLPIGEWWEQQHFLCGWGGRFDDGNHYYIEHDGRH